MLQSKFGDFIKSRKSIHRLFVRYSGSARKALPQKQKALAITSFSSNCKGSKSVTHKQNRCHAVLPNRLNN